MYKVVRSFKDVDEHLYRVGDVFPHADAKKPTNARIKLLSTTNNKYGQIYIQKVAPDKE